jgi:catechol 2,3-dioxygenase-like lactoylglutathione lyase family enzyme
MKGVSLPVTLPLIDHLALRVRDVRRSRTFYEQALEPFGVKVVESSQGPGFAIEGGGDFWIGEGEPPAAPVHVAFAAADRATVDKFHRAAVEAGGRDNGAPGLRPHYHAGYYAAFVIDPDGNNVEAVFHGTASCQPRDPRLRQCSGHGKRRRVDGELRGRTPHCG